MKNEIKKLNKAVLHLKEVAEETRVAVENKRSWMEEKSDSWQDSDAAADWEEMLTALEDYLDEIENLPEPEID